MFIDVPMVRWPSIGQTHIYIYATTTDTVTFITMPSRWYLLPSESSFVHFFVEHFKSPSEGQVQHTLMIFPIHRLLGWLCLPIVWWFNPGQKLIILKNSSPGTVTCKALPNLGMVGQRSTRKNHWRYRKQHFYGITLGIYPIKDPISPKEIGNLVAQTWFSCALTRFEFRTSVSMFGSIHGDLTGLHPKNADLNWFDGI